MYGNEVQIARDVGVEGAGRSIDYPAPQAGTNLMHYQVLYSKNMFLEK